MYPAGGFRLEAIPCLLAPHSLQAFANTFPWFPRNEPVAGTLCTSEKTITPAGLPQQIWTINCEFASEPSRLGNFRNEYSVIAVANNAARSMISAKRETSVRRVRHSLSKNTSSHTRKIFIVPDSVFQVACWSFFPLLNPPNPVQVSTKVRQYHCRGRLTPPTLSFYS